MRGRAAGLSAPSPEPWKVALAEEVADLHLDVSYAEAGPLQRKAEALDLISKHHDPSCPGPTPTRTESLLRMEWWHNHGDCPSMAKYGDDGEMQCGGCRIDFKRMPFDQLEERVGKMRMIAVAKAWEARKALEVKP